VGRSKLQQDEQIWQSNSYDDTIAPTLAAFETNPVNLETDLNNVRSQLSNLLDAQAGDWYADLNTPSALDTGSQRGVNDLNTDLHAVERKRVLRRVKLIQDITVTAAQNWEVLGASELPGNTTAAVGAVTTLGTVVAAHGGTFGTTHSLTEVAGAHALAPKNLLEITDNSGDPILSAGRRVWGLLQTESAVDGHTMTVGGTEEVQISFVRPNAAHTDLEACPVADIATLTIRYCYTERVPYLSLNEGDFLSSAAVDIGAGAANLDRQTAYDNQGATAVDLTTNATLDLEGAGLSWTIRDDLEAMLFQVVEGSAGGTSQVNLGSDVDEFDVDAAVTDFLNGITVDSGSTGIDIGAATAGSIQRAADLTLFASGAGELYLHDSNIAGEGTWAQAGVKLTENATEVTDYETAFGGEVSLFNAIVQAKNASSRTRADTEVSGGDIAANTLIEGPGGPGTPNITADLVDYDAFTFVTDVEVFINGALQRPGANAAANHDVYPSAVSAERQVGAFYAEFKLKGGSNPDNVTMIRNG
jgi:hypothetical protein